MVKLLALKDVFDDHRILGLKDSPIDVTYGREGEMIVATKAGYF